MNWRRLTPPEWSSADESALAQLQLRQHAENLEKTVQERTAKLQELVADPEHFSYTLVHDMRAPLRAMRGGGSRPKALTLPRQVIFWLLTAILRPARPGFP